MSDSLWPCGLQHARLLCPPLSPKVCSNSCSLNWWCYLTISLLPPSPFAFNLSQHQGLCQCVNSHCIMKFYKKVLGLQKVVSCSWLVYLQDANGENFFLTITGNQLIPWSMRSDYLYLYFTPMQCIGSVILTERNSKVAPAILRISPTRKQVSLKVSNL